MKTLLKLLALVLVITVFTACSDDDDDSPIVIDNVMVVYNSDNGVFSSIDLTNGSLSPLGSFTYNGEILTGLRDIVYNSANQTIYASSRSSSSLNNGAIFSVNPQTLEATMLNDNADDDWYALPGIEMNDGKIIGTVYWDELEDIDFQEYYTGLVWLNLDGSIDRYIPLKYNGEVENFSDGMAIEYGASANELYVTDDEDIFIVNTNGNITEILDMTAVGMPNPEDDSTDGLRTLETDENGILYGIDRDSNFGRIDLDTATFTYIATLNPEDDIHVALSLIPENIFD